MYADWGNLIAKYPDIANKGSFSAGPANSYWIAAAEGEVNGALAVRYTVPFSPCPPMVRDLTVDLAYWKMTYRLENQEKLKEYIDKRLEGLINGTIKLTDDTGAIEQTGNKAWASNSYHGSFGPDNEVNWQVDSVWIDDVQSARGQV